MNIEVSGKQEKRQFATAISHFAVFYSRNAFNEMAREWSVIGNARSESSVMIIICRLQGKLLI